MKLYRFSPIENEEQLIEAIKYTHFACHKLCQQSFRKYMPIAGNIGIFCHYDEEYEKLVKMRKGLTKSSDNPDQKYFALYEPITIPANGNVSEATYTHLYIRKPDIYRPQVGDIDFYLEQQDYDQIKQTLLGGQKIKGARIFPRQDLDMIELYDPDIDALGYISTHTMAEKVRIKLSDETKL